jgi:transposase
MSPSSESQIETWNPNSAAMGIPRRPGVIATWYYDTIPTEGLEFHQGQPARAKVRLRGRPPRRVGHNLLLRLSGRKSDVLRFLNDPSVPFADNLAGQDRRMMKLRQTIADGFRSENGAKDFAVIGSVLSTAWKQSWKMLQTLNATPGRLLANIRLA